MPRHRPPCPHGPGRGGERKSWPARARSSRKRTVHGLAASATLVRNPPDGPCCLSASPPAIFRPFWSISYLPVTFASFDENSSPIVCPGRLSSNTSTSSPSVFPARTADGVSLLNGWLGSVFSSTFGAGCSGPAPQASVRRSPGCSRRLFSSPSMDDGPPGKPCQTMRAAPRHRRTRSGARETAPPCRMARRTRRTPPGCRS